ncbi:MAG: hypothetical protein R3C15_13240 [Thermoleophilia bacterium]
MRLGGIPARDLGPLTIAAVVAAFAALWLGDRPAGEAWGTHVGQLLGVESVVLLSLAIVLISTLPWIEGWFDGIDRTAIWHRRIAILGLALLLPHLLLAHGDSEGGPGGPLAVVGLLGLLGLAAWAVLPRWRTMVPRPLRGAVVALRDARVVRDVRRLFGGYERWRLLHRTTGIFVAAGFVHGLLDATGFDGAPALRWSYVAAGGIGVAFYVYREVLAQFFLSLHDFQVQGVRVIEDGLVEVALTPLGRPLDFRPGQFAMVFLEARDGWHRHPFTIASAPHEGVVRVTVKALGDYTSTFHEQLEPGMPAVIGGPHGRFDRRKGTERQVWVGAGVGIAPFLSWLRSLEAEGLDEEVDLFYTNAGEAPFAAEVREIAAAHHGLRAHVVDTERRGRLTAEEVLATVDAAPERLSVFLCGPEPMVRTFQAAFRRAGVPRTAIHREYFDWR